MTQLTQEVIQKRIDLAKAHLAEIGNSNTFRKHIEETEKENTLEAYWKLQDKLSRELAPHLIKYQGSSDAMAFCDELARILNGIETSEEKWARIRKSTKEFLESDLDIARSESLKKLADEAIAEDNMDGYYNLLKSLRKNYDELVTLKGSEEKADEFLEQLTSVIHDRKK